MDFNSLFAQFAPQLTGAADASPMAGAAPSLLGSTRPTTAPPMPMRAPFTAPPPQSRGGGAMDMIAEIAPLILSAFTAMKGDPGAAGALMQGVARGRQLAMDRQLKTEEREKDRKQIAARFLQQVATDAQQYGTLQEHQQYLDYTSRIAPEFDVDPAAVMAIPFSKTKEASQKRTEAQKRLQALESSANYKDIIGTPQESGLSVTMDDGERLTVAQLRARAGLALTDAAGQQVVPTPPVKPEKPPTKQYQRVEVMVNGRKVWAAFDPDTAEFVEIGTGRPLAGAQPIPDKTPAGPDPILREIREMTLANLKANQGQRKYSPAQESWAKGAADDYKRDSKTFEALSDAYDSVRTAAQNPTAAGDMALIFAYMKMLDPGSVVREGEFANAQNAAGVPDRVRNWYNNVLNGTRLNPTQRADFVAQSRNLYGQAKTKNQRIQDTYSTRARNRGIDPSDVVMDYGAVEEQAETPAATTTPATMRWNPATGKLEPIKR